MLYAQAPNKLALQYAIGDSLALGFLLVKWNGFSRGSFASFHGLCSALDFRSFDPRGITCGLWLGLPCFPFPLVGLISALIVIFFMACD